MQISKLRRALAGLVMILIGSGALPARAYDVEANTTGNKVYMLLLNDNPGAVYHSISIADNAPVFVSSTTASIVPGSVAGGGSDLAALEFNIAAGASNGASGDLTVTVSGLAAGAPIDVVFTVPLEVVSSAPAAQGFVGTGEPTPNPGGTDNDGDGVPDSLEVAYGSDPDSADSIPGQVDSDGDGIEDRSDPSSSDPCDPDPLAAACPNAPVSVPVFGLPGFALLGLLLASLGATQVRRRNSIALPKKGDK
ncbi:MAG: hypothetical protein KJP25_10645 [Gammaproteobacteria bacterium]|nr:hypothetical protein [Gammaproteobacteria bacterium]NND38966.1 hypothetical protein [Pseudomonadales bacterium]MBT8151916.1 hypothetical protein [Gammaproteobacteria bacterium]NNL11528.1 hypothetical protein [Pseudomonadales bacterium]NNM10970.1 hypothetical protein [Pseudomonadales bacterium]